MVKLVDHEERKREILHKSLGLFARLGYPQVTYQQLAEVCGLTRTSLYKYFQNKRQIFDEAIYQLVQNINRTLNGKLQANPALKSSEKMEMLLSEAVDLCLANPALLRAIIEYLIAQRRQEEPVETKIKRHTIGLKRFILHLLLEGIENGEFKQEINPAIITDLLYGLLESMTLKIMFNDDTDREQLLKCSKIIISSLKVTVE